MNGAICVSPYDHWRKHQALLLQQSSCWQLALEQILRSSPSLIQSFSSHSVIPYLSHSCNLLIFRRVAPTTEPTFPSSTSGISSQPSFSTLPPSIKGEPASISPAMITLSKCKVFMSAPTTFLYLEPRSLRDAPSPPLKIVPMVV